MRCVALFLLGLLALAWAAPAAAVTPIAAPVDVAARAKFQKSDPVLVDQIALINRLVNDAMTYVDDQEHYGIPDKWVTFPDDRKGDCEDYAISKMELLRQAGWPAAAYARIRGVVVGIEGHAILELLMPSGEHMILDNRFAEPMTRPELERQGYKFFDW